MKYFFVLLLILISSTGLAQESILVPTDKDPILQARGDIKALNKELATYVRQRLQEFFGERYADLEEDYIKARTTAKSLTAEVPVAEISPYRQSPWFASTKLAAQNLLQTEPAKRNANWLRTAESWLREYERHLMVLPRVDDAEQLITVQLQLMPPPEDPKKADNRLGLTEPHFEVSGPNIKSSYKVSIDVKKLAGETTNAEQLMVWVHGVLDHEALHVRFDMQLWQKFFDTVGFVNGVTDAPQQPHAILARAWPLLADPPTIFVDENGPRGTLSEIVAHAMEAVRLNKIGLSKARRQGGLSYDSSVEWAIIYVTNYLVRAIEPVMAPLAAGSPVMVSTDEDRLNPETFKRLAQDVDALLIAIATWQAEGASIDPQNASFDAVVAEYFKTMQRLAPPPQLRGRRGESNGPDNWIEDHR